MGGKERKEQAPRDEVIEHILNIARRGAVLTEDERHGALHGTSLEVVEILLQTGRLVERSGGTQGFVNYDIGEVSVLPTVGLIVPVMDRGSQSAITFLFNPEEAGDFTRSLALRNAGTHCFLRKLGISLDDRKSLDFASCYFSLPKKDEMPLTIAGHATQAKEEIEAASYFSEKGIAFDQINKALLEANERRGFLLGISPDVQSQNGIVIPRNKSNDPHMIIRTFWQGLPYQFISGIEPLGLVEERFLENLQK
jgi:hypothetical protein